jgi:hypothetical protein
MFRKFKLPLLALGAALMLLAPGCAVRGERSSFGVSVYSGPRHYPNGYYDRWGYWHPYRYYRGWYR